MAGKLNGVIPTTTPSGWRSECESTLVPTFSVTSPLSRWGTVSCTHLEVYKRQVEAHDDVGDQNRLDRAKQVVVRVMLAFVFVLLDQQFDGDPDVYKRQRLSGQAV